MRKQKVVFFLSCLFTVLIISANEPTLLKKVDLADLNILKPGLMEIKDDTIFIWNQADFKFYKIKNFKIEKTFGNKGQGPGEYFGPSIFGILGNKIWIFDNSLKLIEYDTDGNFLREKRINSTAGGFTTFVEKVDDNTFFSIDMKLTGSKNEMASVLFFNGGGQKIQLAQSILTLKKKFNIDKIDKFSWSLGKDYCFILPSNNVYRVLRFDIRTRKFLEPLEKKAYRRQAYSEEEILELKEKIKKIKKSAPILSDIKFEIPKFKPPVNKIIADENDNLYVIANIKKGDKLLIDFYNKDLNLLSSFFLTQPIIMRVQHKKLYLLCENESYYLEIYKMQ